LSEAQVGCESRQTRISRPILHKKNLEFYKSLSFLNREFATKYSYLNCEIKILRKIATKDIIDARWWFNILISYMRRATPQTTTI
jgi:hypothetical protein